MRIFCFNHFLKIKRIIINILNKTNIIAELLASLFLFFAVFFMILQIISRDIFGIGGLFPWIWESVIIFNLCLTYIGATVVFKENRHIAIDFDFYTNFLKSKEKGKENLVKLIVFITSLLVIVQVIDISKRLIRTHFVTIPFLTRGHVCFVIGIGFVLIALYAFFSLIFGDIGGGKNGSNSSN